MEVLYSPVIKCMCLYLHKVKVPNSKVYLISNNSPQIGSTLHFELWMDMKMVVFMQDDFNAY